MARAPSRLGDRLGARRAPGPVSTVLLRRPLPPAARGTRRATPSQESQSVRPGNMATLRLRTGSREIGLDAPAMDRFPVGPGAMLARWWSDVPSSTTRGRTRWLRRGVSASGGCVVAACNDVDGRPLSSMERAFGRLQSQPAARERVLDELVQPSDRRCTGRCSPSTRPCVRASRLPASRNAGRLG
jgi:hypothetical protein